MTRENNIESILQKLKSFSDPETVKGMAAYGVCTEKAYGVRQEEMVVEVDKSNFEDPENVKPGMQFQAQFDNGTQLLTVVSISGDKVKLDGNHPLAGQTLHFDVDVKDVREASAEEIDHGHVHGHGGHHH